MTMQRPDVATTWRNAWAISVRGLAGLEDQYPHLSNDAVLAYLPEETEIPVLNEVLNTLLQACGLNYDDDRFDHVFKDPYAVPEVNPARRHISLAMSGCPVFCATFGKVRKTNGEIEWIPEP